MKRLKVVICDDPLMKPDGTAMNGALASLVDADTGEEIGCVRDFTLHIPMTGVITVNVNMLVSEIARIPPKSIG